MTGNARRRILLLMRILYERTDENHTLTMPEIQSELLKNGISADRRVLYEDIEELSNMGQEIIREATGKKGYFLASRLLEDPEISILADGLRAFHFLSEQKTERILGKLQRMASPQFRGRLSRDVFRTSRLKSDNGSVLYHVDMLSQAIVEKKAVAFYYYRLDCRKRREFLNDDQEIVVFPETLLWHEDNYYMIAATEEWDHLHFRLDRMADIRILDDVKRGGRVYNKAELENYIQSSFIPEIGKPVRITLRCEKNCAEEIFERFGNYVIVYGITDTHFKADVSAAPGLRFYSWVFGMKGQVRILAPESVKKRMCELLAQRYDEYKE